MKRLYMIPTLAFFSIFAFLPVNIFSSPKDLVVSNISTVEQGDSIQVQRLQYQDQTIQNQVVFHQLEETIHYIITVQNPSKNDYKLTSIECFDSPYLDCSYNVDNSYLLSASKTMDIPISVTYYHKVGDISSRIQRNQIHFQYQKIIPNVPPTNPLTSNYAFYLLILILCSIILIYPKKKKKIIILLFLFLLPYKIMAEDNTIIEMNNQFHLKDELLVSYHNVPNTTLEVVPYHTVLEQPSNPEKDGYDFQYWFEASNHPYSFTSYVLDDLDLYPKWDPIQYTIQYDLNGGDADNPDHYTIEDDIELVDPVKVGYTFLGWSVDEQPELEEDVVIPVGSMGNRHYVAMFSANTNTPYVVKHMKMNPNGSSYSLAETESFTGTTDKSISPDTKTYKGFISPDIQSANINGDGSTIVTYYYDRMGQTILYMPNRIPSQYREVSYIESSGTQYLNSNLSMPNGFHAVMDVMTTSNRTNQFIIGSEQNKSYRNYIKMSSLKWELGLFTYSSLVGSISLNNIYHVDVSNIQNHVFLRVNDELLYSTSPTNSGRSSNSLYLFFTNASTISTLETFIGRIYSLSIYSSYDTSQLAGVFIPCVRKSDGVVGMYNRITNSFLTNIGSGSFTGGDTIMAQQDILYGSSGTLRANPYSMDGYQFNGWNTKSDGTGLSLTNQDSINRLTDYDDSYITLYAQWSHL